MIIPNGSVRYYNNWTFVLHQVVHYVASVVSSSNCRKLGKAAFTLDPVPADILHRFSATFRNMPRYT